MQINTGRAQASSLISAVPCALQVLQQLSLNNVAVAAQDVSVHLAFLCLLHLANEHGLALINHGELGVLNIERTQV